MDFMKLIHSGLDKEIYMLIGDSVDAIKLEFARYPKTGETSVRIVNEMDGYIEISVERPEQFLCKNRILVDTSELNLTSELIRIGLIHPTPVGQSKSNMVYELTKEAISLRDAQLAKSK